MPNITITRPAANQITIAPASGSSTIILNFLPETSTIERHESDLVFQFDNNARIVFPGFYAAYHKENLPQFEVEGRIIAGTAFFEEFCPDIIPAEGPSSAATSGARFNDYDNTIANLSGGVGSLESQRLDKPQAEAAPATTLNYGSNAFFQADENFGNSASAPTPPAGPYVRAVLYGPGQAGEYVSTSIFFAQAGATPATITASDLDYSGTNPSAQFAVTTTMPAGWQNSWVNISFNAATGRLEFHLTAEGLARMQSLGLQDKPLVDFFHVKVTDKTSGTAYEYSVEIVATESQQFDSIAHDIEYGNRTGIDSIGEFHQGKNENGAYSIVSSAKNDEIILNDTLVSGSSIYASGSSDPSLMAADYNTIKLNEGVQTTQANETTHISSSDGLLTIAKGVAATVQGGANSIDMGKGSIGITNSATDDAVLADGGQNRISGMGITVSDAKNLVVATNSGSNVIHDLGGNVSLVSTQAGGSSVLAQSSGSNKITVDSGSLNIEAYGTSVRATGGGQNTLEAAGGVTITNRTGNGMEADGGGSNSVTATGSGAVGVTGYQYGLYASNGSNSVTAESGAVTITGQNSSGMYATASGVNTVEGEGNITISTGLVSGTVVMADGGQNSISGMGITVSDAKNLVVATNSGSNIIHDLGGNVSLVSTQAGGSSVLAQSSGSNKITVDSGSLNIDAYGTSVRATGGGQNTLEAAGDVTITNRTDNGMEADGGGSNSVTATGSGAVGVTGYQYGLYASNGSNTVTAESGAVTITGQNSSGMYATANGVNTVEGEGNITISTGLVSGTVVMVVAANSGSNVIHDLGGNVSLVSTQAGGSSVLAQSSGSNKITVDSGRLNIEAYGTSVRATGGGQNTLEAAGGVTITNRTDNGMEADGGGSNSVTATGSGAVGVTGYQYGLYASNGSNTVTAASGAVTITGQNSSGMYATANGVNTVEGEGNITISSQASGSSTYAIGSVGGKNYVKGGDSSTVTVSTNTDYGVYSSGAKGLADVKGGTVNISTNSNALFSQNSGVINVTGGTVNLGSTNSNTLFSQNSGIINVTGDTVNLDSVKESTVRTDDGAINITAKDELNIHVTNASSGDSAAIYSARGATTLTASTTGGTLDKCDINLTVDKSTNQASGITSFGYFGDVGTTSITTAGKLTVNVAGTGAAVSANGIMSDYYSANHIVVGNLDLNVTLEKGSTNGDAYAATGIFVRGRSDADTITNNTINVAEDLKIKVTSGGNSSGILALGYDSLVTNTITANNLDLSVASTLAGSRATGIESGVEPVPGALMPGINTVTAREDASITVSSAGQAIGLYVKSGGTATLKAGDHVDVDITSTAGSAYGILGGVQSPGTTGVGTIKADSVTMTIKGDLATYAIYGKCVVTASTVTLTAESAKGKSYGMHSTGGNIVQSASGEALHLVLDADVAMQNDNNGTLNRVIGHSVSGGTGDNISITGDILGKYYYNQITTGAGDDTIAIKGIVESTALYVKGGAGDDTLLLQASSATDFISKYGAWLNSLVATSFIDIEHIEVTGISNVSELQPSLDAFFTYASKAGIDVSIHVNTLVSPFAFAAMEPVAETYQVAEAMAAAYLAVDSSTDPVADSLTQDAAAPVASLAYSPLIEADVLQTTYSTDSEATPLFASLTARVGSVGASVQGAPSGVAADAAPHADTALHLEHNHTQEGSPLFANLSAEASPDTRHHVEPPHPSVSMEGGKALTEVHDSLDVAPHAADSGHSAPAPGMDAHAPEGDVHHAEMPLTMDNGTLDFLFAKSRTPEGTTSEGAPSDAHDAHTAHEPHHEMSLADMGTALSNWQVAHAPQADLHPSPQPAETHFDTPIDHHVYNFIPDDVHQATAAAARQVEHG